MSRDEAAEEIRNRGGNVVSAVSKNTNFLVVGEKAGSTKTDEARAFLETIRASYPEKGNAWVKYALEQAVNNKPVLPPPVGKGKPKEKP